MSEVPLYGLGVSAPDAGVEESGKGTSDVEERERRKREERRRQRLRQRERERGRQSERERGDIMRGRGGAANE